MRASYRLESLGTFVNPSCHHHQVLELSSIHSHAYPSMLPVAVGQLIVYLVEQDIHASLLYVAGVSRSSCIQPIRPSWSVPSAHINDPGGRYLSLQIGS